MPSYREPYTLYTVARKRGKPVYYYRTYDRHGRRTSGKSTGQTNRDAAIRYCDKLLREGKLVPRENPTLNDWDHEYKWWLPGRCEYTKREALRGAKLSASYQRTARQALDKHILPRWRDVRLADIRPKDIEDWLLSLRSTLKPQSCNNVLGVLSTMLSEAVRVEILPENPCTKVRRLAKDATPRGILTLEEAGRVLDPSGVDTLWTGQVRHYVANLVAASTGMRRGEVLALTAADIHGDHIHVAHSWDDKTGLKGTKTGGVRDVPLPPLTREWLDKIIRPGYLISADGGHTPIYSNQLLRKLRRVFDALGIDWRLRNIGFHSWRHWYNTQLRARGIPDSKIRAVTGHTTAAMTDNYTGYLPEHYAEVIEVQRSIFG